MEVLRLDNWQQFLKIRLLKDLQNVNFRHGETDVYNREVKGK